MSGANLLFVFTGSIAAYKACDAVSRLVQKGHRVRTVATPAALQFIGPATLEGLTGSPVLSEVFTPGAAMEHINLTRWADAVVVCPATANTINRLAAGLADDFPGALFLAHVRTKPWLMVPAMNPAMWSHPATVDAVEKLQSWGVRFVEVGEGRLACGETGEGRLAEPEQIVAAVEAALQQPARRLRVLVTSGGTAEPIDGVRVLTNTSTGATGAGIASHLSKGGHEVVLLRARQSARPDAACREVLFGSFAELDSALATLLGGESFDAVIHAAAVSDFGVESIEIGEAKLAPAGAKLDSQSAPRIQLKSNPKLVDTLRGRSANPRLIVVAFKLTQGAGADEARRAVRALFQHAGADFVVHNDLSARRNGADFPADIYRPDGSVAAHCATRRALASSLEQLLTAPVAAGTNSPCSSVST
jgi:phosphopantothenoylcysteine decarboxylase/phosphopantothenate--cysteine ligase